jgi:asparagine synthase (glutamine-hydrolysing)
VARVREPVGRQEVLWQEAEQYISNEDEAVEELDRLLRSSVQRQLASGHPGVFLSGGLDSSLVAALLVAEGVRPELFTLDFGEPWNQELPFARLVAQHVGLPLQVVDARPRKIREAVEQTAAAMVEPFGDSVTVPLYLLGRAAADRCEVVFNGEGGDQLFGGWTNKPLIAAHLSGAHEIDLEQEYLRTNHRFWPMLKSLLTPEAARTAAGFEAGQFVRPALCAGEFRSLLHRLRAANLRLKGAQNIAPRMVQLAQCHGLSVRAPFFNRELAEWTFSLPPEWLLAGPCEKHLLKRVAEKYLPEEIVWREKRGIGAPVTEWCMGEMKRGLRRVMSRRRLTRDGWFDTAYVGELLAGSDPAEDFRPRRLGEKVWCLAMLHWWSDAHGVELGSALHRGDRKGAG